MREFHILQAGPIAGALLELGGIDALIALVSDGRAHEALFAQSLSECAGIDAGESNDSMGVEKAIESLGSAPVGRCSRHGACDDASEVDFVDGLEVFVVCADIADMRKGESDDLSGIGGVGQDFLVAGDRGVEAELADIAALSAESLAEEFCAVFEDERASFFSCFHGLILFVRIIYDLVRA